MPAVWLVDVKEWGTNSRLPGDHEFHNFTPLYRRYYLPKHKTYSNTGRSPVFLRWYNNQLQRVLYFFSELQLPSYSIRNFIFFNSFLVYRVSVLLYHACILCNRALILSIVRESYQVYRSIWGVFPIYTIVLILSYL